MRLIDADALKKHYAWWEDDRQKLFDSIVDQQPTVDTVEYHGGRFGWVCPICGRGLSPYTNVCPCQNGKGWEVTCD